MAKKCQLTGKKGLVGNNRSHAMNASRRKWNVNLQKVSLIIDGKPTTMRVSARALRAYKHNKKLK